VTNPACPGLSWHLKEKTFSLFRKRQKEWDFQEDDLAVVRAMTIMMKLLLHLN